MHSISERKLYRPLGIWRFIVKQKGKSIHQRSSDLRIGRSLVTACSNITSSTVQPVNSFSLFRIVRKVGQKIHVILLGLALIAFSTACEKGFTGKLIFALPVADWWTAAPFIISQSNKSFEEAGIEIVNLEVHSGLASKNAVLAGTANIGLTAATPLALAAARKEKLVILGTYLHSSAVIGLVRPNDLPTNGIPPEPIAIVPHTISESFLYQYLTHFGKQKLMEEKKLKELHLRPADIPIVLGNGSARSAVIWEPFFTMSAKQSGFTKDELDIDFQVNLYLITRQTFYQDHKDSIKAFLLGVENACRYITENPEEARRKVESFFGFRADFLASTWPKVRYGVSFDLSRMKDELRREASVSKSLGYINTIPSVDYLFDKFLLR